MSEALAARTFKVRGITCMDCVVHIAENVRRLPGTRKVSGNLTQGTVKVAYDPGAVSEVEIARAIEEAGYQVVSEV